MVLPCFDVFKRSLNDEKYRSTEKRQFTEIYQVLEMYYLKNTTLIFYKFESNWFNLVLVLYLWKPNLIVLLICKNKVMRWYLQWSHHLLAPLVRYCLLNNILSFFKTAPNSGFSIRLGQEIMIEVFQFENWFLFMKTKIMVSVIFPIFKK